MPIVSLSAVESAAVGLARKWQEEVEHRREWSKNDVAADILARCASSLMSTIQTASVDDEELSPAEFGALPHVDKSASTVRRWCAQELIVCRRVGRDYLVRRGAAVPSFGAIAA